MPQWTLRCANFQLVDVSDADVTFCHLAADRMVSPGDTFDTLKKGCRILSRRFEVSGREIYNPN
ncbi:MAG: hypothetical protein LJE94_06795 [Deltaproteobacteria bacterium]|nr:hypothetical protein [Deltaproteobacteria bacterium]